ncbi:MAG: hypothetical protein M1308_10815 [Actinobacteria bacterium]|nr:hypothetical protein [Actinomycetota bacterium]
MNNIIDNTNKVKLRRRLNSYIAGFGFLAVSIGLFLAGRENIVDIFKTNITEGVLIALVGVGTIIWYGIYMATVIKEVDLLDQHLHKAEMPNIDYKIVLVSFFLSIFFGVALGGIFISDFRVYIIATLALRLFDTIGGHIVNSNVYIMTKDEILKNKELSEKERDALFTVSDYYLKNPILLRCIIMIFLFFCSLILYLYFSINNYIWFKFGAYIIVIVTIIVGESFISAWRIKRDRKLKSLEK